MSFDFATVQASMEKGVRERGADYVYSAPPEQQGLTDCLYVHKADNFGIEEDTPGCIVGYILHDLGVSLNTLSGCEGNTASMVIRQVAPEMPEELTAVLDEIQSEQDAGHPWGRCLDIFKTYA